MQQQDKTVENKSIFTSSLLDLTGNVAVGISLVFNIHMRWYPGPKLASLSPNKSLSACPELRAEDWPAEGNRQGAGKQTSPPHALMHIQTLHALLYLHLFNIQEHLPLRLADTLTHSLLGKIFCRGIEHIHFGRPYKST